MTLKLSVNISAPREVCVTAFRPAKGLERTLRSWPEFLPQSLKLKFSLMISIYWLWPVRALQTRMTGSSGATRPSCG